MKSRFKVTGEKAVTVLANCSKENGDEVLLRADRANSKVKCEKTADKSLKMERDNRAEER